jgi:molybdopterin/thiamine biosynthesis adenylyltransferase
MSYTELFKRNYGIFTEAEQERIRRSRILIIGCGGIGGTVANILARSGVEKFILVEFDSYEPTNANRQIGCFTDTYGRNKAEVVKEMILGINPDAQVETYCRKLDHEEIVPLIKKADIVFPAADDLSFSVFLFRDASRIGKPSLYIIPAGTWAHISLIMPGKPLPEDIEGSPKLTSYAEIKEVLKTRKYKYGTYHYVPFGNWNVDYYDRFLNNEVPPAQICPVVWIASSIGAFEVIKHLSGKWVPVASPRYYSVGRDNISIRKMNGLNIDTLLRWQRIVLWKVFQTPFAPVVEVGQLLWWKLFRLYFKARENRQDS